MTHSVLVFDIFLNLLCLVGQSQGNEDFTVFVALMILMISMILMKLFVRSRATVKVNYLIRSVCVYALMGSVYNT